MHTSFKEAVSRNAATEALHIATIAQESLCLLTVETLRFKSSSLVKMHKLGNVGLFSYIWYTNSLLSYNIAGAKYQRYPLDSRGGFEYHVY